MRSTYRLLLPQACDEQDNPGSPTTEPHKYPIQGQKSSGKSQQGIEESHEIIAGFFIKRLQDVGSKEKHGKTQANVYPRDKDCKDCIDYYMHESPHIFRRWPCNAPHCWEKNPGL